MIKLRTQVTVFEAPDGNRTCWPGPCQPSASGLSWLPVPLPPAPHSPHPARWLRPGAGRQNAGCSVATAAGFALCTRSPNAVGKQCCKHKSPIPACELPSSPDTAGANALWSLP